MKLFDYCIFISLFVGLINLCTGDDLCRVKKGDLPGRCKLLNECPIVLNDVTNGIYDFSTCTISNPLPSNTYVCCFDSTIVDRDAEPKDDDFPLERIHQKKCKEYSKAAYEYKKVVQSENDIVTVKINKCGHKAQGLIVGGEKAKPREFPHMVTVGTFVSKQEKNGVMRTVAIWNCGGTLISERYVLTAAHCFNSNDGPPKLVRIGELDFSTTTDDAQPENLFIEKLIPHPEYIAETNYNDIGLMKLQRDVEINPWKRPACLPSFPESGEAPKVLATGWGYTKYGENKMQEHLLKVTLDKFSFDKCSSIFGSRKNSYTVQNDSQICYGSYTEEKDTCQGDSGGPIQIYYKHKDIYCMYEIVGVTSFGVFCGIKQLPAIYTKVYNYIDWIENIVWN